MLSPKLYPFLLTSNCSFKPISIPNLRILHLMQSQPLVTNVIRSITHRKRSNLHSRHLSEPSHVLFIPLDTKINVEILGFMPPWIEMGFKPYVTISKFPRHTATWRDGPHAVPSEKEGIFLPVHYAQMLSGAALS